MCYVNLRYEFLPTYAHENYTATKLNKKVDGKTPSNQYIWMYMIFSEFKFAQLLPSSISAVDPRQYSITS